MDALGHTLTLFCSVCREPISRKHSKTVVTCKIKHLQKCFRAVDFPRLCRGRKNVVKMFYFTCNHGLRKQKGTFKLNSLKEIVSKQSESGGGVSFVSGVG